MPISIEQQLLHAALICGLVPGGAASYRLQLFLVANRDLGSTSHQNDFQRAIETAVDRRGFFENAGTRGSGEYVLTDAGFHEAKVITGTPQQRYRPIQKSEFRCTMSGKVARTIMEIRTRGAKSTVYFNGARIHSAKEVCQRLESLAGLHLKTEGDSAVRVLQDLAVDRGFQIEFE